MRNTMEDRPFVHLHCHSHYSLLDGANRIPELVERTKKLGMNALALTDHGNLYGAIEFYRECKERRHQSRSSATKPMSPPASATEREARRRGEAGFHLTLLAKNATGFKNLIKMASIAFLEGYHYVPRIDKELLEAHHEGIICLSGCASSEFSEFILKDQMDEARRLAEWFAQRLRQGLLHRDPEQRPGHAEALRAKAPSTSPTASACRWWPPATPIICAQDDSLAHDVLLCINTGKLRSDENRMRYGSDQFYVRPPEEMYKLFPDHEDAVQRSQEIADSVDIELDFKKRHFPVFTPPEGKTPEDFLRELCARRSARALRRQSVAGRCSTGWSTSWASSAGWASPATSSSSGISCASP